MAKSNANTQSSRVSDEELLRLGDDPIALRMAYERCPELQQEFLDFGYFSAYLTGLKNGQSHVCHKGGVVRSREADQPKTFLAN